MDVKEEFQKAQTEISALETKADSWFKSEFKDNWKRIIVFIVAISILVLAYYDVRDEFKTWLKKPTINQTSTLPININANGKESSSPAPTYVNINPIMGESTTATLKPSTNNKTPSVIVTDPTPVFNLNYNGKKFDYVPYTTEQYNFDPKTWQFDFKRQTEMNVNVEVPTPRYSMGIGVNTDSQPAITGSYRIRETPFNVWGYASSKDQAIGLNFTQYSSSSSKKKTTTSNTTTVKGGDK